ncbi:hypothetical protein Tco_0441393, partial [Tanacetum coccineum]
MLGSDLQGEDFAKKMVDLVNQKKKHYAEERARAKRNKPMTQSQLGTYIMNYLKNQGIWKLSQLKNLSFEEVKEEFDKLVKQSDEAKEDESTKKTGKRRKQIARKGLHSDKADEDESEDSKDDDPISEGFRNQMKSMQWRLEILKSFSKEEEDSCGDPNYLVGECPKPPRNKDQKDFVGGSWSDSEEEGDEKNKEETCLMAHETNEVCLKISLELDEWIKDSGCSKHMTCNKNLFSTYKAYDGVDDDDGDDGRDSRRGGESVEASGVVGWVDRKKRNTFGVRRKNPPENVSGGGRR